MANLKDLKNRIKSVRSTQKITSAMKMVAAAKLRRAQDNVVAGRPYADRMKVMVASMAGRMDTASAPPLLVGTGTDDNPLLVIVSADRGLCGGFNGAIIRTARGEVGRLQEQGKKPSLLMVGRKAADALRREFGDLMIDTLEGIQGTTVAFNDALLISTRIQALLDEGRVDTCAIVYNRFVSAISQEVTHGRLIPVEVESTDAIEGGTPTKATAPNEYEPDEASVLNDLLPRALTTAIYAALLESSAAELAARMTAMDNATRNAGDLIDRLTMEYNRTRQAAITTELIEIISGAEAL